MLDLVLNIQAFEQAVGDIPSPSPVHIAPNPCKLLKLSLMLLIAIPLKQFARQHVFSSVYQAFKLFFLSKVFFLFDCVFLWSDLKFCSCKRRESQRTPYFH